MNWKLFFFLTFTHYVMSYKRHPFQTAKDHPHWKLIEQTYDTRPQEVIDDVGVPLLLTPFIEDQKIEEARREARVNDTFLLPGIESYAGYLTVNKAYNGNLWFWYFPVARSNRSVCETPLILWLQGGPGASSLYGLFTEIGPYSVLDSHTLTENKHSWGKDHSLLFIDNPVGTGFSFTDMDGYATNQTTIGENLYTALQQFLTIFPELRQAPLFIAGESYAGKHIPSLGIQIHWHKNQDEPINLQGLAIGNGFIDPVTLVRYSYFGREVGLVDDNTADSMKSVETDIAETISNKEDTDEAFYLYGRLLTQFKRAASISNIYNYLTDYDQLIGSYTKFVQRSELRRALHVGNTRFSRPEIVYYHLITDIMNSAKPWLEILLEHYPVLVYSGHLDCIVPYHASVNTYSTLEYSGAQEYKKAKRFSWYHNGILAGYVKSGGNLQEVMVRGAGHMVPGDKPAQARGLISSFIRGIPLSQGTGDLD